jgi:prepilin-type N-terminal cleavage/methylation domain-containing protein
MRNLEYMMHFKSRRNKTGFTLVETMLAMVIVGIVLTPIFLLFGTIQQRMNKQNKQFYALLSGKQLLYEARQKQAPEAHEFALDKKLEESGTTLHYALKKSVDAKSSLVSLDGLHKEIVTIDWTEMGQKRHEQIIAYVYKQPEQKKQ